MVPVTISSRWEFRPSQGTPAIWVEGMSQTLEPAEATKPRSAGAVMRAASPRAKVREVGSTHWAGWERSSLMRATRVPFSMAGPRSKCPSVALPLAPSPTLTVSVVRAVLAGALFEARVAASASVASRVTRVAMQRSVAPALPLVLAGAAPRPLVVPPAPLPEVAVGLVPPASGVLGVGVGGCCSACPVPPCCASGVEGAEFPGGSAVGGWEPCATHEASSATSIV